MGGSKNKKIVKQAKHPDGKTIHQGGNPERYYQECPAWAFACSDQDLWAFSCDHLGEAFWQEVFPRMRALETQTWKEILVRDKKQNHSLSLTELNKRAQDRLIERYIEAPSLISLRITGKHRLYGYMTGRVFNVLWYDDDHGDNSSCVCRSHLKHT